MAMVVAGTLRFLPAVLPSIWPHLRDRVETKRQRDGCIAYDVAVDAFDLGLIRFPEMWPDMASLEAH